MTTVSVKIDIDLLNELLENQKKLDDLFLDDDPFLDSSVLATEETSGLSGGENDRKTMDISYSSEDVWSDSDDVVYQKTRSLPSFIMLITTEIAVIYYGITYFS